jgi:hypothetical protein
MMIVGVGSGRTAPSSLTQGIGCRTVSDVGKGRGGQGTGTGGGMTVSAVGRGGGGGRKMMGVGTGMGGMMVSSLSMGAGLGGQLARGKKNICAFAPGATTSKRVAVSKCRAVMLNEMFDRIVRSHRMNGLRFPHLMSCVGDSR